MDLSERDVESFDYPVKLQCNDEINQKRLASYAWLSNTRLFSPGRTLKVQLQENAAFALPPLHVAVTWLITSAKPARKQRTECCDASGTRGNIHELPLLCRWRKLSQQTMERLTAA